LTTFTSHLVGLGVDDRSASSGFKIHAPRIKMKQSNSITQQISRRRQKHPGLAMNAVGREWGISLATYTARPQPVGDLAM